MTEQSGDGTAAERSSITSGLISPRETPPALQAAKRVVIKVGSSLVTNDGRGLDARAISTWGRQIAALRALGKDVVMV